MGAFKELPAVVMHLTEIGAFEDFSAQAIQCPTKSVSEDFSAGAIDLPSPQTPAERKQCRRDALRAAGTRVTFSDIVERREYEVEPREDGNRMRNYSEKPITKRRSLDEINGEIETLTMSVIEQKGALKKLDRKLDMQFHQAEILRRFTGVMDDEGANNTDNSINNFKRKATIENEFMREDFLTILATTKKILETRSRKKRQMAEARHHLEVRDVGARRCCHKQKTPFFRLGY